MHVERKELPKAQVQLTVELSVEEFAPFLGRGAAKVSEEVAVEGFRPGKAPFEVLKQKVGEMTILEAAARIAIEKTLPALVRDHVGGTAVGQPQIEITKLAPGNPLGFTMVTALLPTVTLGTYKGLKIKRRRAAVEPAAVERVIAELRESRVSEAIADRPLRMDDKALIDIRMFLDKVPLEGGQSDGVAVVLGKDYIVPGFDKQLVGMKKGDSRDFILPYPAEFHLKHIAGKRVEFTVTLKEIYARTLPAADDALAAGFGLKHYDDLAENVRKSMLREQEQEQRHATEREVIEAALKRAAFGDIAESLVDHEVHGMIHELEHEVEHRGGKFEDYLSSIGKARGQLMLELAPEAVKRVKVSVMIGEIAKAESIVPSAADVEKQLEAIRAEAKDDAAQQARTKTPEFRRYVENVMQSRTVVEKLVEWNVEDDKKE